MIFGEFAIFRKNGTIHFTTWVNAPSDVQVTAQERLNELWQMTVESSTKNFFI